MPPCRRRRLQGQNLDNKLDWQAGLYFESSKPLTDNQVTFVDGHQNNYYCRVVEDCVGGSSYPAHDAALNAMEYLQAGARCKSTQVLEAFAALAPSKVA